MPLQLSAEKYPHWFLYFLALYFTLLIWALLLSSSAYTFMEAQLLLLVMLLPALLLAFYAFRLKSHHRLFRGIIVVLGIIAMAVSAVIGYMFFG